jgi:hypothetical protein
MEADAIDDRVSPALGEDRDEVPALRQVNMNLTIFAVVFTLHTHRLRLASWQQCFPFWFPMGVHHLRRVECLGW